MDKRERVLSMGYLVKSPAKNKDKANFSKFWKLRWCVFVEIICKSQQNTGESVEEKKLVFYYFKDKESHQKDENAKGQLNITSCKSIKSCYQSQAGFDHLFKIECSDGNIVKFSAPSCQTKFRWISILYNHKFNTNIKPGMSGLSAPNQSSIQRNRPSSRIKRFSGCFEEMTTIQHRAENLPMTRTLSLNQQPGMMQNGLMQKDPRRDSGRFSIDAGVIEEAPPLPPRRDTCSVDSLSMMLEDQISICSMISDEQDINSSNETKAASPRKTSFGDEKEFNMLQIFNDLFMLCETCQSEAGSGKRGSNARRRSSTKKMKNFVDEDLTEVEYEAQEEWAPKSPSFADADSVSRDTVSSGDSNPSEVEPPYSEISEEWLRQVREKTAQLQEAAEEENKKSDESSASAMQEKNAVTEEKEKAEKTEDDHDDDDDDDEFIYEDMSQFSKTKQDVCAVTIDGSSNKDDAVCGNEVDAKRDINENEASNLDGTDGVSDIANGVSKLLQQQHVNSSTSDDKQPPKKFEQKIVFQMTM